MYLSERDNYVLDPATCSYRTCTGIIYSSITKQLDIICFVCSIYYLERNDYFKRGQHEYRVLTTSNLKYLSLLFFFMLYISLLFFDKDPLSIKAKILTNVGRDKQTRKYNQANKYTGRKTNKPEKEKQCAIGQKIILKFAETSKMCNHSRQIYMHLKKYSVLSYNIDL